MFLDKYLFVLQNFTDAEKLIKINTKLQTPCGLATDWSVSQ